MAVLEEALRNSRNVSHPKPAPPAPELSQRIKFPGKQWGWDRARCDAYVQNLLGERWRRSCCGQCCFGFNKANLPDLIDRWRAEPDVAAEVLLLEHTALALNERMLLFGKTSAHQLVRSHGLTAALERYRDRLETSRFAVYDVRRVLHASSDGPHVKGPVWRSVTSLASGSRAAMTAELAERAAGAGGRVAFDEDGIARALVLAREQIYPTTERLLALAPVGAVDKELKSFGKHWTRVSAARAGRGDVR